jgi:hypothetical protein
MSHQVTVNVFIIRRLHIELMVVVRSTGLVKIDPYQCRQENLRLWTVIAKTQTLLAQATIELHKNSRHLPLLHSLFRSDGWEIKAVEERVELSL